MNFFRRNFWLLLFVPLLCLAGPAQEEPDHEHVGRVLDWSYRHLVVSGGLSPANLEAAKTEPRILFHLAARNFHREASSSGQAGDGPENDLSAGLGDSPFVIRKKPPLRRDWSVSLGAGSVAPNNFPAKFGFDINATPDCLNDYALFALNVAGVTNGQANIVGINQLYSGPGGICGANPNVNWAYNGSTSGGSVLTSPVMSLDGKKIAYVESAAASAIFHVLTLGSSAGTVTKAAAPIVSGSCLATTSCLKSVTFSSTATATLASPWVDYETDKAFVGSDDGKIYKISCVFKCPLNSQPTVLWTFALPVAGTGGAAATPNGPVYDFPSGNLFVGDQLGELWVINAQSDAMPTLAAGPVMIGGGGCTVAHPPGRTGTGANCNASGGSYGIPDSILFDSNSISGRVYAFSGNDGTAGASAVVAQLESDLTGLVRVHVGRGSVGNITTDVDIHSGDFDNKYFGATPANGHLYVCGTVAGSTAAAFYWIGFTAYPTMNSATTGTIPRGTAAGNPCTPITEIFNPNVNFGGGDHDIIISGVVGAAPNGVIRTDDISNITITGSLSGVNYSGGVSAIIFDDVSASGQASSVYFSTLQTNVNVGGCNGNIHCAVKLTQLSLQ
jgi:hypothetical protein